MFRNKKVDGQHPNLTRLAYAAGDFANNFSWALVASYLMYFWTDVVLIPASVCGTFMLLSKGIDAAIDHIIGAKADKTKTKWGHYRPWVLFASIPMLVFNVLGFVRFPSGSMPVRAAYALIVYIFLIIFYSSVNIPYSVMPAAMTRSDEERSKLSSWRMTAAFTANFILIFFTLRVVEFTGRGSEARGFAIAALIFSAIALPIYIFCFAFTKETVPIKESAENTSFKDNFKVLKGNKPVKSLVFAMVMWGFYEAAIGAVRLYYFKYYVGDSSIFSINASLMVLGRIIGTASLSYLVTKVSNKRNLAQAGFFGNGILMLIMTFILVHTVVGLNIYHFFTFLTGIGGGLGIASIYGMIPDCSEVSQVDYKMNAAGFISSFVNFAFQFGMAICTAAVGWILDGLGYVANIEQASNVLTAINYMMNFACGVVLIIAAVALINYNIDKHSFSKMRDQLDSQLVDSK